MSHFSFNYLRFFVLLVALLLCTGHAVSSPSPNNGKNDDRYDYKNGKNDRKVIRVKQRESIQAAIDKAQPYTRIEVEGHHREQVTISKDGISLVGKGAKLSPPEHINKNNYCYGKVKIGTGPENFQDVSAGICIHGRRIKLTDAYDPAALHWRVKSVGDPVKDVSVSGFEVSDFDGENIAVYGGKNTKIYHNKLKRGLRYGFLTVGSTGTEAYDNEVSGAPPSTLSNGPIAMCMDDRSSAVFSSNKLSDYFIGLCTETNEGINKNNKISKCCVGNIIDPDVYNAKSLYNEITEWNTRCDNFSAAGISLLGAKKGLVKGNRISIGTGAGVFLGLEEIFGFSEGNTITKNVFGKNDADIFNNATRENYIFDNECDVAFKLGPQGNVEAPEYCRPRGRY